MPLSFHGGVQLFIPLTIRGSIPSLPMAFTAESPPAQGHHKGSSGNGCYLFFGYHHGPTNEYLVSLFPDHFFYEYSATTTNSFSSSWSSAVLVSMIVLDLSLLFDDVLVCLPFCWCPCMAINVSVQYSGGLLPDIILLTQCYYHRGTRLNAMKRFCIFSY